MAISSTFHCHCEESFLNRKDDVAIWVGKMGQIRSKKHKNCIVSLKIQCYNI